MHYENNTSFSDVGSLRDVKLEIPTPVGPGETAMMLCSYDLEDEPLYTVTWYKGRQEFFRFVPKELPHTRVFPLPGIHVDVSTNIFSTKEYFVLLATSKLFFNLLR